MREIRLLPLVAIAAAALVALKIIGLMVGPTGSFGGVPAAVAQTENEAEPAAELEDATEDQSAKEEPETAETERSDPEIQFLDDAVQGEDAETLILTRLRERREQLDARERELDLQENLLKAAEARLEERLTELKEIEARLGSLQEDHDLAEDERFQNVVTMYESMKPKDAARVFDRLDLDVLVKIASRLKARAMAEILAAMSPEQAEALTVALADEAVVDRPEPSDALPQIVGTEPNM